MSTRVSTEVSTPQVRELRQPGTRARSQWARAVKVGEAFLYVLAIEGSNASETPKRKLKRRVNRGSTEPMTFTFWRLSRQMR